MPTLKGEITTETEFEFEVFCKTCGEGLCLTCEEGNTPRRGTPFIRLPACKVCIEDAKKEAYDEGYEKAKKQYEE